MAQPLKSEKEGEKTLSLQEIIVKVTNMVSWDSKAQRMAKNSGLNINYVSWEDCARNMGSSWGPCISDMTLQVNQSCMPVMREPNYTDKTWDVAIDKIPIVVGNHTSNPDEPLQTISLKEYLKNFSNFMSNDVYRKKNKKIDLLRPGNKDSHVIMSSQACFLPIQQGAETKFNVALYNYQSKPKNPAVLVIVSTSKGSSAQIIEGTTQYLVFNNNGKMADFVGERVSDVRMNKEGADVEDKAAIFDKELSKEEKQDNVIVVVQIPLIQKVVPRRRHKSGKKYKKKQKSKAMIPMSYRRSSMKECAAISDDEDANIESAIVKVAERKVTCICGQELVRMKSSLCYDGKGLLCDKCGVSIKGGDDEVYHCISEKNYMHKDGYDLCIKCGEEQLKYDELRGMMDSDKNYELKRNQSYPVRVTLQYYKATDNGSVTKQLMEDIAKELKQSAKQADFMGSLVTKYDPNRPTNWIKDKKNNDDIKVDYTDTVDGYDKISKALKEHCGKDWEEYLKAFKDNEVMDKDLKLLEEADLKELIPKMGPRNRFKAWMKQNNSNNNTSWLSMFSNKQ